MCICLCASSFHITYFAFIKYGLFMSYIKYIYVCIWEAYCIWKHAYVWELMKKCSYMYRLIMLHGVKYSSYVWSNICSNWEQVFCWFYSLWFSFTMNIIIAMFITILTVRFFSNNVKRLLFFMNRWWSLYRNEEGPPAPILWSLNREHLKFKDCFDDDLFDLPSRLIPNLRHFCSRQYWHRFRFTRSTTHCLFRGHW